MQFFRTTEQTVPNRIRLKSRNIKFENLLWIRGPTAPVKSTDNKIVPRRSLRLFVVVVVVVLTNGRFVVATTVWLFRTASVGGVESNASTLVLFPKRSKIEEF